MAASTNLVAHLKPSRGQNISGTVRIIAIKGRKNQTVSRKTWMTGFPAAIVALNVD